VRAEPLAEQHRPGAGRQRRVHAHEQPEEPRRDPPEGDQIGRVRNDRAQHAGPDGVPEAGRAQPPGRDQDDRDRQVQQGRHRQPDRERPEHLQRDRQIRATYANAR
jgi:hypothetical protein